MKIRNLLKLVLVLGPALIANAGDDLKAFPPAEKGMARHVLRLPALSNEATSKVEIIVGKTVQVDKTNKYFLGGKIEEHSIPGWGYTRYEVGKLGPMAGTLMAADPKEPKIDRFVTLGGEPYLVRYNSKLPVVVYVPEDAEVRYRLWSCQPDMKPMDKE